MPLRPAALYAAILAISLLAGCGKSSNETPATASSSSSPSTASPSSGAASSPALKERPASSAAAIPAGTVITVRVGESLSSKTSQAGQSFSATVAQPVVVDGKTVIPSGANATGTVVNARPLGRFKGGALLQVRLNSVSVNGSPVNVQTAAVSRSAKGKGKRSLIMAGGGAGVGALIGGLAGGGKGAAIGALAGGGAGTAGAAFTGNKDIVIPAESAISFKLLQPIEVR